MASARAGQPRSLQGGRAGKGSRHRRSMGGVRAGQARADEAVQPGAGGLRHRRARRGRAQPERRRRRAQGAEGPALCSHARTAVWCQRRSAWMRVRLLLPCKHAYDQPCSFSKVGSCLAAAMIRKCPLRGASCVKPARGAGCARHPSWRARTDLPSWQSAPGEGKSAWAPTALSAWVLVMESPGECAAYAHLADAPPAVACLSWTATRRWKWGPGYAVQRPSTTHNPPCQRRADRDRCRRAGGAAQGAATQQTLISRFMPTSRRIVQFSDGRSAPPDARIVYIDGAFDLFHPGHVQVLKARRPTRPRPRPA